MSYCTFTDVYLEAGTAVGTLTDANITSLITRSEEEISDILTLRGITAPATSTQLKTASICFTIAKIKRRQSQELSRPNSLSIGGDISFSVAPEVEAKAYEEKAHAAINLYISTYSDEPPTEQSEVRRCDAFMGDFALDQSPEEVFFSELP